MNPLLMVALIINICSVLTAAVPTIVHAQDGRAATDFRGRTYTEEDLATSLFEQAPSKTKTRGFRLALPKESPGRGTNKKQPIALNVFFDFNSDRILEDHYGDLDKLGKVLSAAKYSSYRIQIDGHTDNVGADSYNQHLSQKRAESVRQYLVQHFAIQPGRLVVRGHGRNSPIDSNETPEGRDRNRRVEVVNLGIK